MKKLSLICVLIATILSVFCLSSCGEKSGNSLEINGKEIACHMNMEKVLSNFSDMEYDYSESISCAYNGLDKTYDFSDAGFTVYTYPDGDEDFVLEVVVYSENIKQQDGKVFVGMSKDAVTTLFGENYEAEGDNLVYDMGDGQTRSFLFDGDAVVEYAISAAQ